MTNAVMKPHPAPERLSLQPCTPTEFASGIGLPGARHILLADDDDAIRHLSETALTKAGYLVDVVADGEPAWAALCARTYDLLITDHEMPRLTGVELVFRARQAGLGLPVVLASGAFDSEMADNLAGLDLTALLRKPFGIHELLGLADRFAPLESRDNSTLASTQIQSLMGLAFTPPVSHWGLNE